MDVKIKRQISKIFNAHKSLNHSLMNLEREKLMTLINDTSEEVKTEVSNMLMDFVKNDLPNFINTINEYKNRKNATIMIIDNVEYDMRDWATISQYAKMQGYKSTNVVSNQLKRGKLDKQNIAYIPELDIKLIRIR